MIFFTQECSNDDIGLTLTFFMARSILPSGLLYGKRSYILQKILMQMLILFNSGAQEQFCALEVKILL